MMPKCSWSCLILSSFSLGGFLSLGTRQRQTVQTWSTWVFSTIGNENHSLSSQHSNKNNEDFDLTLILGSPLANAQVRKRSHSDWSVQVMLGFSHSNQQVKDSRTNHKRCRKVRKPGHYCSLLVGLWSINYTSKPVGPQVKEPKV